MSSKNYSGRIILRTKKETCQAVVREFTKWCSDQRGITFAGALTITSAFAGWVKFRSPAWKQTLETACRENGFRWWTLSERLCAPDELNYFMTGDLPPAEMQP